MLQGDARVGTLMLHRRNRNPLTDRTQYQAEIEKLVASHALHGSESLCKLLRYLGKQALEHPGVPVKEYQIASAADRRESLAMIQPPLWPAAVRARKWNGTRVRPKKEKLGTARKMSGTLGIEVSQRTPLI